MVALGRRGPDLRHRPRHAARHPATAARQGLRRPVDFDILTGKSAQGVYTDFLANAVLIMVDEAKDTADAGRWSERRAVYERLKAVIDPRAIERSFVVKGLQTVLRACASPAS